MANRLSVIENKVEAVLGLVNQIKAEKVALADQNARLKSELTLLKKEFESLKLTKSDKNSAVRAKLESVLTRVDELESLVS